MPAFTKLARELEESALFVSCMFPPTVLGVTALRSVSLRCLAGDRRVAVLSLCGQPTAESQLTVSFHENAGYRYGA